MADFKFACLGDTVHQGSQVKRMSTSEHAATCHSSTEPHQSKAQSVIGLVFTKAKPMAVDEATRSTKGGFHICQQHIPLSASGQGLECEEALQWRWVMTIVPCTFVHQLFGHDRSASPATLPAGNKGHTRMGACAHLHSPHSKDESRCQPSSQAPLQSVKPIHCPCLCSMKESCTLTLNQWLFGTALVTGIELWA